MFLFEKVILYICMYIFRRADLEKQGINRDIFKAYDIRGLFPGDWSCEDGYKIARAFVSIAKCKSIVVGHDMRDTAPELVDSIINGVLDQGCDVYNIGLTSTPMYYFAVNKLVADGGIQATASHNTKEYNGLKMVIKGAIPAVGVIDNDELWSCANNETYPLLDKKGVIREVSVDILDSYCEAVLDCADIRDFQGLKIAVDCGNGMGGFVLPTLFEKLGCQPIKLYWRLDGSFPNHTANPLDENTLLALKDVVVDNDCDLGIAYDGDADRVGFVDEKGNVIPGDFVTALIGCELLKSNPGKIIMYDLRSSWSVKEAIELAGGVAKMCRVGHGPIKTQMRAENGFFAGELSSHYYFQDFFVTDNGDLAMLNFVKLLLDSKKKASELTAPLKKYFKTPEINSKVVDTKSVLSKIEEIYTPIAKAVFYLDGFSAEFADWWFNVRASNTEPLIRLNLEAKNNALKEEKAKELLDLIRG